MPNPKDTDSSSTSSPTEFQLGADKLEAWLKYCFIHEEGLELIMFADLNSLLFGQEAQKTLRRLPIQNPESENEKLIRSILAGNLFLRSKFSLEITKAIKSQWQNELDFVADNESDNKELARLYIKNLLAKNVQDDISLFFTKLQVACRVIGEKATLEAFEEIFSQEDGSSYFNEEDKKVWGRFISSQGGNAKNLRYAHAITEQIRKAIAFHWQKIEIEYPHLLTVTSPAASSSTESSSASSSSVQHSTLVIPSSSKPATDRGSSSSASSSLGVVPSASSSSVPKPGSTSSMVSALKGKPPMEVASSSSMPSSEFADNSSWEAFKLQRERDFREHQRKKLEHKSKCIDPDAFKKKFNSFTQLDITNWLECFKKNPNARDFLYLILKINPKFYDLAKDFITVDRLGWGNEIANLFTTSASCEDCVNKLAQAYTEVNQKNKQAGKTDLEVAKAYIDEILAENLQYNVSLFVTKLYLATLTTSWRAVKKVLNQYVDEGKLAKDYFWNSRMISDLQAVEALRFVDLKNHIEKSMSYFLWKEPKVAHSFFSASPPASISGAVPLMPRAIVPGPFSRSSEASSSSTASTSRAVPNVPRPIAPVPPSSPDASSSSLSGHKRKRDDNEKDLPPSKQPKL